MAKAQSSSMQAILDKAIEAFRRQKFLESVNAGYAALRSDPTAWDDELRERSDWDQTLLDGLGPNEAIARRRLAGSTGPGTRARTSGYPGVPRCVSGPLQSWSGEYSCGCVRFGHSLLLFAVEREPVKR